MIIFTNAIYNSKINIIYDKNFQKIKKRNKRAFKKWLGQNNGIMKKI